MVEFPEKFNSYLIDDDEFKGRLDFYVDYMCNDGIWGGNMEIFALSEAFKIKICLFQESLKILTIGKEERFQG